MVSAVKFKKERLSRTELKGEGGVGLILELVFVGGKDFSRRVRFLMLLFRVM